MQFDRGFRRRAGIASLSIAVAGVAAAAALAAAYPAAAASALATIAATVNCSSTTGCTIGNNSSSGPGLTGTSAGGSGITASGITGITATGTTGPGISASAGNGYGIFANSNGSVGIKGLSNLGYGVEGASNKNYGVYGISQSTTKPGVYGTAPGGYGVSGILTASDCECDAGVYGQSPNGAGVIGSTTGMGFGVRGLETGNGTGVEGETSTGYALDGESNGGTGLYAYDVSSGDGAYIGSGSGIGIEDYAAGGPDGLIVNDSASSGDGADVSGTHVAIWGRSSNFPLALTDANDHVVFYVDGSGNVFDYGTVYNYANSQIAGGAPVQTFTAKSSLPTVEDTGTAQLVAGAAAVRLDPTFAGTIDPQSSYRVFLTPDGDTNGLYVATKTPAGFIVRETKGGRSTLSFDYRIVATALGQSGKRMAIATAAFGPHLTHALPARRAASHWSARHK